jgi:YfiH family protein
MDIKSFKLPVGKVSIYNDQPEFPFYYPNQDHSSIILHHYQDDLSKNQIADGIRFKNLSLNDSKFGIKTADCLPIVLIGKTESIVIHAGWRGIHKEILKSRSVIEVNPYFAFIGPSIQHDSFQVTSEFKEHFPNSRSFVESGEILTFNLQQEAINQLLELNPKMEIQNCAECTYKDTQYNSYRRDKTDKRNWNIYSI